MKLLEGDLVYTTPAQSTQEVIEDIEVNELAPDAQNDVAEPTDEVQSRFKTMVRPLTAADIESGKFTVFDVVLPLPGHDITYPANDCARWYEERLAQDDLSSEKLKQKHK